MLNGKCIKSDGLGNFFYTCLEKVVLCCHICLSVNGDLNNPKKSRNFHPIDFGMSKSTLSSEMHSFNMMLYPIPSCESI